MEGFWLSPYYEKIPVIEHLITIQQEPHSFGLTQRDVAGQDVAGLRQIAEDLIHEGWIRYRYLAGTHYIEMGRFNRDKVERVLFEELTDEPMLEERLVIEVAAPRKEYVGTIAAMLEGSMFHSWQTNPKAGWRFCR